MEAWLTLSEEEWDRISVRDPIRVTSRYYFTRDKNREDIPYSWIKQQMSFRMTPPLSANSYPIKVYVQLEGNKRPDLRTIRHWYPIGERMVLATMVIPDYALLLADQELWMYVVNHWYIPRDETDANRHKNAYSPHPYTIYNRRRYQDPRFQDEVISSWEKVFDLTINNDYITSRREKKSIIGWVWEIARDNITRTRPFQGASKLYS